MSLDRAEACPHCGLSVKAKGNELFMAVQDMIELVANRCGLDHKGGI